MILVKTGGRKGKSKRKRKKQKREEEETGSRKKKTKQRGTKEMKTRRKHICCPSGFHSSLLKTALFRSLLMSRSPNSMAKSLRGVPEIKMPV